MDDFDIRRLQRELATRHGIRISADDPALAIVMLNQLVLEEANKRLGNEVREVTEKIDKAGTKVQNRAGSIIAQEVRLCASAMRQEFNDDMDAASQRVQKIVNDLHQAHSKASLYRNLPVGLLCSVMLLACGFWIGWMMH